MSSADIEVIIPAYNAEAYIAITLASVVSQTVRPVRIIVIDDGSSDNTVDTVKRFATQHPSITIECVSQANSGVSSARNLGLEMVTAEFVAMVDADDVWLPTKLEKQLAVFMQLGGHEVGLVYCGYGCIDDAGRPIPNLGYKLDPTLRGQIAKRLRRANQIAGSASAVLLRSSILRELGTFDARLVCAEDWDLWLRIAEHYAVDFAPEELVLLRRHSNNAQNNERRMLSGELLFTDKQLRQLKLPILNLARLSWRLKNARISASELDGYSQWCSALKLALSDPFVFVIYWSARIVRTIWRVTERRLSMLFSTP